MKYALLFAVVLLAGCTRADKARETLENNGYTDIEMTGYAWFACADGDTFHDGFIASSPNGKKVEGEVCGGWLKGSTIRFE